MTETQKFFDKLTKEYGSEVIYAGDETPPLDVVSTGSVSLDFATGIGGFPRGTLVEIYGKEGVGKTTLSYYMIAEEQKRGGFCVFINLEGRFSKEWASRLGVDCSKEKLYVASPASGNQAADILYKCINSGLVSLVVFDSVGAMLGEEELDGKDRVGGQAKLVTGMVKRILLPAYKSKCTVVFLNQARDQMNAPIAGLIESPGGRGLKHACAIRIEMKRTGDQYQGIVGGEKKMVGYRISCIVKKNKLASPNRKAQYDLWLDPVDGHQVGIDREEEVISLALRTGVIQRNGAWYVHPLFPEAGNGKNQLQGGNAVFDFLKANPDALAKIWQELNAYARDETKAFVPPVEAA